MDREQEECQAEDVFRDVRCGDGAAGEPCPGGGIQDARCGDGTAGEPCPDGRIPEDPLIRETVHLLLDAARGHKNLMAKSLDETGVFQSQHRILMYLSNHTYESQKQIAKDMHISTAAAAVSIKKLEAGGYLTKEMDPNDNRVNTIRITPKGRAVVEESLRIFPRVDAATFEGVSREDLQILHRVLEKVMENLERLNA